MFSITNIVSETLWCLWDGIWRKMLAEENCSVKFAWTIPCLNPPHLDIYFGSWLWLNSTFRIFGSTLECLLVFYYKTACNGPCSSSLMIPFISLTKQDCLFCKSTFDMTLVFEQHRFRFQFILHYMVPPYFSCKYNDIFEIMYLKTFKKHKIQHKSKKMINYYQYILKMNKGQYNEP